MEIKDYETLLTQAYQTAPIGLCLFDAELRYRHINEWLASINGHSVEEHLGRTIDEVIPDVSAQVESQLRRVMESGEHILNDVVEAETTALSHQKRSFQYSCHAVKTDEGIVEGVSCIVQDITERKRVEEAHGKNQERLALAMDVTSEGLWDWNIATGDMFYSPEWCAALGYDPSEVEPRGRFWESLVHPDDMPHFKDVLNAHFEGKTITYECEVRLRTKSGEYRWNLDRGKVVAWDDDGMPLRMVGVDVDINERKQVEESLRESEERYLSLSEASFEGLMIHDKGGVIDANTRIQEMFGYSLEELTKMSAFELVAPEDREIVRQNVAEGKEGAYEAVGLRKDSTTFPMDLQARHLQYRGQRVRVVACQDITERKRAEKLQSDQRRILELISTNRVSQTEVFEAITKVAEDHLPGVRSTILLLESNKLRHGAGPSMPNAYNEAIDGMLLGPSAGSCGTAAYRKERVVVEDIRSDPLWVNFRYLGEEYGFRSCWSQPILDPDENVLGTFALYHELPGSPSDAEIHFIESMANLAGIAIERNRAEKTLIARAETERLLLQELDHRVRNNLASLISLIDLSRSGADTMEAFAESIKGRAQTIASVHSALSRSKWHAIELRSLLNTLMVIGDDGHIKFDGPTVIIPPEQAQAVGLIAHELATNSRKYGALSRPNGSVVVSWEEQLNDSGEKQVHIRWLETGGPPIETEPKPGTGMSLISGLVNYELRGQVNFRFPGLGADHTIVIPLPIDSKAK